MLYKAIFRLFFGYPQIWFQVPGPSLVSADPFDKLKKKHTSSCTLVARILQKLKSTGSFGDTPLKKIQKTFRPGKLYNYFSNLHFSSDFKAHCEHIKTNLFKLIVLAHYVQIAAKMLAQRASPKKIPQATTLLHDMFGMGQCLVFKVSSHRAKM